MADHLESRFLREKQGLRDKVISAARLIELARAHLPVEYTDTAEAGVGDRHQEIRDSLKTAACLLDEVVSRCGPHHVLSSSDIYEGEEGPSPPWQPARFRTIMPIDRSTPNRKSLCALVPPHPSHHRRLVGLLQPPW